MFGSSHNGANSYAKVAMETGVISASPHKLIVMLFDGVLVALITAIQQIKEGNIPEKGKFISKSINIIDNGLRASLDLKVGGEIALSLDALYEYMSNRLLLANIRNDIDMIQEVYDLLADLKSAWDGIGEMANTAPATENFAPRSAPSLKTSGYDTLAPRSSSFVSA